MVFAHIKDAVDPRIAVREHCTESHCKNYAKELETCNARVASKSKTSETCTQELFDLLHCVDHCVRDTHLNFNVSFVACLFFSCL